MKKQLEIIRPRGRNNIEDTTGLGLTRIYALEAEGKFPARIRLSDRAVGWYRHEVDEWLKSRPRAADSPPDVTVNDHATRASRIKGGRHTKKKTARRKRRAS